LTNSFNFANAAWRESDNIASGQSTLEKPFLLPALLSLRLSERDLTSGIVGLLPFDRKPTSLGGFGEAPQRDGALLRKSAKNGSCRWPGVILQKCAFRYFAPKGRIPT
jgi:hypothetical protein